VGARKWSFGFSRGSLGGVVAGSVGASSVSMSPLILCVVLQRIDQEEPRKGRRQILIAQRRGAAQHYPGIPRWLRDQRRALDGRFGSITQLKAICLEKVNIRPAAHSALLTHSK